MHIISGIYWDRGMRQNNQDSLMLEQVYTRKGRVLLALVSDGIGGLSEGDTASGLILEQVLLSFYQDILKLLREHRGRKMLEKSIFRCFYELNQMMNHYGKKKEIGLGATVTLLLIYKRKYLLFHLGDSRCYQIGLNHVKQLTVDHADHLGRLTGCLGSFAYRSPDVIRGRVKRKTGFLLCTDGFYHYLDHKMMKEALNPQEIEAEEQIEKRLRQMALYGMKQGEKDNVSAVYIVCK